MAAWNRGTTEGFIQKARAVHGKDRYDYSRVVYVNAGTKVEIVCSEHGSFWQGPSAHLAGQGCPVCAVKSKAAKLSISTEEFITRSSQVHNGKYDYSKVIYTNNKTRVEIICPEHGNFWQFAEHHMKGRGCPVCGKREARKHSKLKAQKAGIEFEAKARGVHGDAYNYSLVEYRKATIKVVIICSEHGEFLQKPSDHLAGYGCPQCGLIKSSQNRTRDTSEFIKLAQEIHGDKYDYQKVVYKKAIEEVEIICPVHGGFGQRPADHLQGKGCRKCGGTFPLSTEDFKVRAAEVHNGAYDYSQVEYINTATKVKIICPKHGKFWQTPNDHLDGHGCHLCQASSGERRISAFLSRLHIKFVPQKKFAACRTKKRCLSFDFYFKIGDLNFLVEYDGLQHFEPVEMFGGEEALKRSQRYDAIKDKFASKNGFILIRIPYTEYDNLEYVLRRAIEEHTGQPLKPRKALAVSAKLFDPARYQQKHLF